MRIFRHTDKTGENAADRWAEQLTDAGAEVDAFRLDGLRRMDGQPVNDLKLTFKFTLTILKLTVAFGNFLLMENALQTIEVVTPALISRHQ